MRFPSPQTDRGRQNLRIALLLTPAISLIILLFMGGLLMGFIRSLNYFPLIGLNEPNLEAYRLVFTDREFFASFLLTFHIAFTSTVIASILAVGAALLLRPTFRGKKIISFFFQMNLTFPHLVGAIGILFLFSQSGFLARILTNADVISRPSEFPALIYDRYAIGIILQYIWKEIPFIGVIVLAVLQSVGEDYEAVAQSLGANRWQRFRYVTLPLIMPGVLSASVIVFAFTFGAYEIPFLLGRSYPAALPVLAVRSYTDVDLAAKPQAMAMAMVIAVLATMMILAYMNLTRRYVRSS
ncbi:MAG: ABC transporter permease subunit [Anaerolineaceae bacterium]|nr:ABC transporter permease subunit [Anaerolineaceae bacterium]MCY3935154.1 ABC transporter permease subunit [Chloroflexota bacterium]MCY4008499.1 ABC transporter permease subunit [Anaerolineaceae bacterium]MCY4107070.1 ABC transporter permease subunit [Chloroflexota bacterium]